MAFDPGTVSVLVFATIDGQFYTASGTLVSENQVLTAAHVVHNGTTGDVATSITVVTGGPNQAYIGDNGGYYYGDSISADMSHLYYNRLSSDTSLTASDISKDFAVFNLESRAEFNGDPLGWLALLPAPEFAGAGGDASVYGYPVQSNGDAYQTSTPESLEGPYSGGDDFFGFYNSDSPGIGGQSGGSPVAASPAAIGEPFGVAGVNSTGSSDGSGFAALTDGSVALVEYWRSLGGNSPAARRMYRGLLNREPDDLQDSSAYFVGYAQQVAASLGVPAATAEQVYSQFPEAGPSAILSSQEFTEAHPDISDEDLVNLCYTQGLGRTPSEEEVDAWISSGLSQDQIANQILNSAEGIIRSGVYGQDGY